MIRAGRVKLNGVLKRDPETPVRTEKDRIEVDGHPVEGSDAIYLMMNKPRGLVTTAADEKGRATVYSLLAAAKLPWVAPVGRLDKASEGLLLLTNDSEWGARIAAPETHLPKTYHVQIGAVEGERIARQLMDGIREQGELLRAVSAGVLRYGEKNCWLEIVLDEGRNRQIRRMLAVLGIEVLRLIRIAIGPLQLGTLAKGTYRSLRDEEKLALDRVIQAPLKSNAPNHVRRRA
jgi:23S rRNA pseudouridine2605 synthase